MSGDRRWWLGWVAVSLAIQWSATAGAAPWEKLLSLTGVDADPAKSYDVQESNGPWMILTCSFSGPKADQQAKELVLELRKRYKLPAYRYEKKFELGSDVNGLGIDRYGQPRKMKYLHGQVGIEEVAVMVGDYPAADDPKAQETLRKLKYYQPESLKMDANRETARSLAGWRAIQSYLLSDDNAKKAKGPMGHAFITTNPLLPADYYAPQGLDEVVLKANEGVEHSLLNCPSKYTVMIAHFSGRSKVVLTQKDMAKEISLIDKTRPEDSALVKAAENAHEMTEALRAQGVEAYEFHDRNASIVTIGGFDHLGPTGPDGKTDLDPRIQHIIDQYKSETQAAPGAAGGAGPKELVVGKKKLPFVLHPIVVQIPKQSISTALRRR